MRNGLVLSLVISCMTGGLTLTGCSKGTTSDTGSTGMAEDSSASGIAASAVGGTISATDSTPSMGIRPFSGGACPTILTANGSGCTNDSANAVSLTYSNCSFGSSSAVFSGTDLVEASAGLACGSYPTVPDNNYLGHQYTGTRTSASGTVVTIAGADGSNYTGTNTTGTGEVAFFTGGLRHIVTVYGVRYTSPGKFDHTVGQFGSTGISVSISGATITANGTLLVYHNLEKVTGTVTLTNVVYSAGCCQPTGGSISTTFAAGTNGNTSSPLNGKTETLSFSGTCGQGSYTGINGNVATVTMPHCL